MLSIRQNVLSKEKKVEKNFGIFLIQLMKFGLGKNKIYSIVGNNLISREQ